MQRLVVGSLVSAVLMFLWGFVFWAAGLEGAAIQHGANDAALRKALAEYIPASGTYVPDMEGMTTEQFERAHREAPIAM